ncbi:RTA1 like protein-domain-containing protein [Helicostylum pulchrum]|nr:RTA1 like protein-domain-containing protein [Helicostylum pulchrum]
MESGNAIDYFHYTPSKSLATMSAVTYALLAIYLVGRTYTSNSASFLYILPVVSLLQATGFLYRIFCIDSTTIAKYIVMNLFLIIPPYVLPLVNYMALGKFIRSSNIQTNHFFLNPTFVTWFFFVVNLFTFWVERIYNDGDMNAESAKLGVVYILLDLCVYSILSTCFIFITTYVYQNPNYVCQSQNHLDGKGKFFSAIYATALLQFIRTLYLSCKYATGLDGYIASSEWAFYIFDALPIMLSFTIYCILFLGDYLPKEDYSKHRYNQLSRFDNADEEDTDMYPDGGKHVAVFNNVQSVNYSIGLES